MDDAAESTDEPVTTVPTMRGFVWSPREIRASHRALPGDLWCIRDGFSALMGWEPGSDEWSRFIEAPAPGDMERLTEHLALSWFDPEYRPHREALQHQLDHPGLSVYAFHTIRMSHCLYQPHVRHLRTLPPQYAGIPAELYRIIVDTRQSPATAACWECASLFRG